MSDNQFFEFLATILIFRIVCVVGGCLFGYLGYRLFRLGVYEKQGELKASWGGKSLTLMQVGPGVLFALFGIALALVGIIRQPTFKLNGSGQQVTLPDTVSPMVEQFRNSADGVLSPVNDKKALPKPDVKSASPSQQK